jgi:hypothetical protein
MICKELTTFLKSFASSTHQKARQYGRYDEPGGYDFYHSLKKAALRRTVGGHSLQNAAVPTKALNNLDALPGSGRMAA